MGSHKVRFTAKEDVNTRPGEPLTLGIRPENIEITDEGSLEAKVYSTLPSGMETVVKLEAAGFILTAVVFGDSDFRINDTVKIRFRSSRNHLFRKEGDQERIASGSLQSL
jgi:multiple sugar transport system ATP-binding protein